MKKITFLGDSLTHAGRWQEFFPAHDISNHGVPGERSSEILLRIDEVLGGKPDLILLMMGINDLGSGIGSDIIIPNFKQMIQRVKVESSAQLIIQSLLPVNFQLFPTTIFQPGDIEDINMMLKTLCKEENITYVDMYPAFASYANELIEAYTYDGLHLNDAGYRIWVNCLRGEMVF
jgi:lysophospholipase L1-like esterase